MNIVHEEILIDKGDISITEEWIDVHAEIYQAIASVVWPPNTADFTINPTRHGNGVKPIKEGCMVTLEEYFGWQPEAIIPVLDDNKPGKVDALKQISLGNIVFEWETGNISSSHRALNKIALGMLNGTIVAGILVLPTRKLYPYLTDRIGNYEELQPYFPVWRELPVDYGLMLVIAIEHDAVDETVPLIAKGTDGRALI